MIPQDISTRVRIETQCRSCKSESLRPFLDLGSMPLADRLVNAPGEAEPAFPLVAAFCPDCALVQILQTVDPEVLFTEDYPYFSSFSPALLQHSRQNALARIENQRLGSNSLVVELASNDGYLLKNYAERGIPVLGIDPAPGPAAAANAIGVHTEVAFFTSEYALGIAAQGVQADVIHANNVLAHVADTNGFVAGIGHLLKPGGVAVIEVPYLKALIDHVEFDTIYHEHLCYFSLIALDVLFRRHGLYLNDAEHLSIHGGSLRIFVEKSNRPTNRLKEDLAREQAEGLDSWDYFEKFGEKVAALRDEVCERIAELKASGARIAAYGAAAKGATLLNYCGIGPDQIDFVVDRNTHKQGKFMPGRNLPIRDVAFLSVSAPDYVLLLAWNFADEILVQQQAYRDAGGRFIVPIPSCRVV